MSDIEVRQALQGRHADALLYAEQHGPSFFGTSSDAIREQSVMPGRTVGVLALQGDVREHATLLTGLGVEVTLVRTSAHLAQVDGLVIPGGESSVIDRLTRLLGLREPLLGLLSSGLPVLGTCAGLILLADRILDAAPGQQTLGGLDVTVRRNAYGSQVDSFEGVVPMPALGAEPVAASFIRAPVVEQVGPSARVLGELDGRVVAVEQGAVLGVAFHPELSGDARIHRRFLDKIG